MQNSSPSPLPLRGWQSLEEIDSPKGDQQPLRGSTALEVTVPTFEMHNIVTVSTFKMHNVGTVPTNETHNLGTELSYATLRTKTVK